MLWLTEDDDSPLPANISRETSLEIHSKSDLATESSALGGLAISAHTGDGIDRLIAEIALRVETAVGSKTDPALTQERHRQALQSAADDIGTFLSGDPQTLELRAEDIRRAAHAIGRITGRVDVEDVLGQLFSRFCIGK